jgi:hypothetical protein
MASKPDPTREIWVADAGSPVSVFVQTLRHRHLYPADKTPPDSLDG